MSKYLTKEQFRSKRDRRYIDLQLPSGGMVRLQSLTERERAGFEARLFKAGKKATGGQPVIDTEQLQLARAKLAIMCLVDEKGDRIFEDEDYTIILDMNAADAKAIGDACNALNGHDDEMYEDLLKNSAKIHVADSQ